MGVDDSGDADPAPAELLDDHRVGRQVEAHPAVLLGDRYAEQPELLHLLDDRLGEAVLVVVVLGVRDDLLVRELVDHLADRALFVGDVWGRECHGVVENTSKLCDSRGSWGARRGGLGDHWYIVLAISHCSDGGR